MIKKLLLIATFALSINLVNAQCTPVPFSGSSLTNPTYQQGLSPAVETVLYSQIIHVRVPLDTTIGGLFFNIDSAGVAGITGLPASISWATNTVSNYWQPGTFGCLIIQGTPLVGDAGAYPVVLNFSAASMGTGFPYTANYTFNILDSSHVGIDESKKDEIQSLQNQPNPFDVTTNISFYAPTQAKVIFSVYNLLGKTIETDNILAQKGKNTILFNRYDLPKGIYIYEIRQNNQVVRNKMIIN